MSCATAPGGGAGGESGGKGRMGGKKKLIQGAIFRSLGGHDRHDNLHVTGTRYPTPLNK